MPRKGEQSIPIDDWRKQAFLEWLCTPPKEREPKTMELFAKKLDIERRTLTNWKVDPIFLREWERRYRDTVGSFEKVQEVVETLRRTAIDREDPRHVQAAKQYLETVDAVKPQRIDVNVKPDVTKLSDEELEALMAQRVGDELANRRAKGAG